MLLGKFLKGLVLGCGLVFLAGCSSKSEVEVKDVKEVKTYKVFDVNQHTINATINSLADQLFLNKKIHSDKPVIVTSFVQLDQFKKTSEFGRVVGESLINELSNRDFNLIEFRGQMAVSINDEGEYFLTRKIQKLKGKIPNTYVVVGTYSRQAGRVMLNARVIDNITGKILSSARSTFVHNLKNDCLLFNDCRPTRTIKLVEEK